ncbi:MAG: SpoVA/SpoVAEb family sporulation membrane protein [Alphaproteobacteria bacterium]|nr:SpoVA/SpoVAEb family sporulation membrane protein [Alphaproteobacteria bacterium]
MLFFKSLCPILTAAEGWILGVGAKMFTIAGPVIVYGTIASVIYGVIYWLTTLF